MRIDHLVIHLSEDKSQHRYIKQQADELNIPFHKDSSLSSSHVKVFRMQIGQEYLKLVKLFQPENNQWEPLWNQRFQEGHRGLFSIFLETDYLNSLCRLLSKRGIHYEGPKQPRSAGWMGLFQKDLPWQYITTPPLKGTGLEIGFISYDNGMKEAQMQKRFPHTANRGINGIHRIYVQLPEWQENLKQLQAMFPNLEAGDGEASLPLEDFFLIFQDASRSSSNECRAEVATLNKTGELEGRTLDIENVHLRLTSE